MSCKFPFGSSSCVARFLVVAFTSFAAVPLMTSLEVRGQDTWVLSSTLSGDWNTDGNWSAGVPTAVSAAYIVNGGTATVTTMNTTCGALSLGSTAGNGTVQMTGGSLCVEYPVYIGDSGTGTFVQSGGTNVADLVLGNNSGSSGTYDLSGSGIVAANVEYVSFQGAGTFTQSGGTNSILSSLELAFNSASSRGTYSLSGNALLSADSEFVGISGHGNFVQSGGTNNIQTSLNVGSLSGGTGTFSQYGGTTLASSLSIASGGSFLLAGGTLQVGTLVNQGSFTGGGTPATLIGNGIVDLSNGANLAGLSVSMGSNSLLIVPAGFNTSMGFASYGSLGVTYTLGSTLVVPAACGFSGSISINDPVSCQGTIAAPSGGTINLNNGLALSGSAAVTLGFGKLTVNDNASGMSGGGLSVYNNYVGMGGAGIFSQSGGANTISNNLCLGYNAGDSGTYKLGGTGQISASFEYVGLSGTGAFTQSAGNNTIGGFSYSSLYLGYYVGSSGMYNLGGGNLSLTSPDSGYEYVGNSGKGDFTQTGGTNQTTSYGELILGNSAGGCGTYTLSGSGLLSTWYEVFGASGSGTFTQMGGLNVAGGVTLGYGPGFGAYNLSGSGQLSAEVETVGAVGAGVFKQSGGTNSISNPGYLNLGFNSVSSGTYNLSGNGLLSAATENVGNYEGNGSFMQSGGTNRTGAFFVNNGSTYTLNGSGSLSAGSEIVGYSGVGTFTQSAGTNGISGSLEVGGNGGAYGLSGNGLLTSGQVLLMGSFTQSGGTSATGNIIIGEASGPASYSLTGNALLSANTMYVGYTNSNGNESGVFTQTGGTCLIAQTFYIGYMTGSYGTCSLSGNGYLSAQNEYSGWSASALFLQSGGTNVTGSLTIGYTIMPGTYMLSGNGLLSTGNMYVAVENTEYASSRFIQSGGTCAVGQALYEGYLSGSSGSCNLTGSGLLSARYEKLGWSGTGVFTQTGGTNSAGALSLAYSSGSAGSYNLNGGLLNLVALSGGSGTAAFSFSGGTVQAGGSFATSLPLTLGASGGGATFDTAGFSITLAGPLSGPGSLTKVDSGTLVLSDSNDYSGGTFVDDGTLVVTNAGAMPTGANLTIGADGTFIFDPSAACSPVTNTASVVAVPEPSTFALLGLGVGLLGWAWRRREKNPGYLPTKLKQGPQTGGRGPLDK